MVQHCLLPCVSWKVGRIYIDTFKKKKIGNAIRVFLFFKMQKQQKAIVFGYLEKFHRVILSFRFREYSVSVVN